MAAITQTDAQGKPMIQAEELTERIAATIDSCSTDYAVGYAAIFGALEQLKAQYYARVALKIQQQSPGEVLAIHEGVSALQVARMAAQAEEAAKQKATPEKLIATKAAARAVATKKAPRKR
ncbi:hypothetical protein [Paraburkholderia phenoliruptrix]|uniref:hypothetical protein n=1 Tax=Paraburkholderia phenoliruptrix TaxID=252970 RepID=UPI0034CD46CD